MRHSMKPDLRADYKIRLYTGPKNPFFEVSILSSVSLAISNSSGVWLRDMTSLVKTIGASSTRSYQNLDQIINASIRFSCLQR